MNHENPLILKSQNIAEQLQTFSHPWNPQSEICGAFLGRAVGLKRTGVNYAKLPPGKESFVYHAHTYEEEWLYILAGHGIVEIDDAEFAIAAGDFIGFPTPSVAHHLRNTGDEDLVYLMGGENREMEVAEFPRLGKRMLRRGDEIDIYNIADAKPFGPLEP